MICCDELKCVKTKVDSEDLGGCGSGKVTDDCACAAANFKYAPGCGEVVGLIQEGTQGVRPGGLLGEALVPGRNTQMVAVAFFQI